MKRNMIFLSLAVTFSCVIGNGFAQRMVRGSAAQDVKKAIAESRAITVQAFVEGDSALFIDRYTPDCWIMPAHADPLCGEDAPLDFFRTSYHQLGIRNETFNTAEVHALGPDMATEMGLYQLFDAEGKIIDCGKFLVLWKKTSSGWKMFRDSFSSNRPDKCL